MKLLVFWGIGVAIAIITAVIKHIWPTTLKVILTALTMISTFFVACIPIGWIGGIIRATDKAEASIVTVIIMLLLIVMANLILYAIEGFSIRGFAFWMVFNVVLIIGSTVWFFPSYRYNENIEEITEVVELESEKRNLIYFCNIPLQNISGSFDGSSVLGTGNISGNISTTSEISFWYENSENGALHDTAPTEDSKLVFVDDIEIPYINIVIYGKQITKTNHNNGNVSQKIENIDKTYVFYLPSTLKQFKLN